MRPSLSNTTDANRWNVSAIVIAVNFPATMAYQPPAVAPAAVPGVLLVGSRTSEDDRERLIAVLGEEAHASDRLDLRPYDAYRRRRLTGGN